MVRMPFLPCHLVYTMSSCLSLLKNTWSAHLLKGEIHLIRLMNQRRLLRLELFRVSTLKISLMELFMKKPLPRSMYGSILMGMVFKMKVKVRIAMPPSTFMRATQLLLLQPLQLHLMVHSRTMLLQEVTQLKSL